MYVCMYLARSLEIPAAGPSNLGCHTPRSAVRNRSCTSSGIALRLFLFLISYSSILFLASTATAGRGFEVLLVVLFGQHKRRFGETCSLRRSYCSLSASQAGKLGVGRPDRATSDCPEVCGVGSIREQHGPLRTACPFTPL